MSTMTDTIMQQVAEQAKKAMEAANSARPLPHFDYVLITGYEPSDRHVLVVSHRHSDEVREAAHQTRTTDRGEKTTTGVFEWMPIEPSPEPGTAEEVKHGLNAEHPMLKRPQLMTSAPKPHNERKFYEFREQNGSRTAECRELRKALHELADKGQINYFLKKGARFLRQEREPARIEPCKEECSTKILATITSSYAEGITQSA
ncbi:hypothetical protein Cgig2_023560 [Carnegiea gigantea]|uniref:Uncharacterized protein n=1 Tax=Carnegiea gigantea TaxID=171969 RepID=A0A9Q1Q9V2_9CARY|nr:hypothetical protein Cgig2_023560 [Carnegiea gigantea]